MALEKHVCMHSCKLFLDIFWNEKGELFRKNVLKKERKDSFLSLGVRLKKTEAYVL
jgi:hypothetical protein